MAARSIGSVTLLIGLVAIPTKLFTATSKREIAFNRLERKTGARVKQPTVSSVDGGVLGGEDLIAGYEYTPDKFVTFESDELKALELEGDPSRIRVVSIVPAATLDVTHVLKSVFLGPNKGGEPGYHLLGTMLRKRKQVAIGRRGGRTRDELVVIAPKLTTSGKTALVLHECLYVDEVRSEVLEEVAPGDLALTPLQLRLAGELLEQLEHGRFREVVEGLVDTGAVRVKAAVDCKVAGQQIVIPPPRDDKGPIDLLEQLRASVPERGPKKAGAAPSSRLQRRRAG